MVPRPLPFWNYSLGAQGSVKWSARLLIAVTVLAYATSFNGALVFDDIPGIANNPTIRDLTRWDLFLVAIGPQGGTLSGRPVPNLTLALNYAISGSALWSYHAVNLLIHLLAGLTLFGLVRRTLLRPVLLARWGDRAVVLALVIAGWWSLHPLQTESVTYLVQRVESLMGLCYLLTLYFFVRSIDAAHPGRWQGAAFVACLTGMGCKEVMVTAPLVVMLYDRTFVAATWREVWQRRRWFYGALMSTWLLLLGLMKASGGRGGTAGFETGMSAWSYALTQCQVILAYLKLAVWPHPLIFDHNLRLATGLNEVWPQAFVLLGLLAATVYLLVRRPMLGFLGAWFFVILAPTSSVVPVADAMVEHRMYLPLAAVIALGALGLFSMSAATVRVGALGVALALGITTAVRNFDYRSPQGLWEDVIRKNPASARAHNNLGAYLFTAGRNEEARTHFATALRLDPRYASAYYNLGQLLEKTAAADEAVVAYEAAIRFNPKRADAEVNLGYLLDRLGRSAEAAVHYEAALRLDPDAADIHAALGATWLKMKRLAPAIEQLKNAAELDPNRVETWYALAHALQQQGDPAAARRAAERALKLKADYPELLYFLGNLAAAGGDFPTAIGHYERATDLAPGYLAARNNLANALLVSGRTEAAILQYRRILKERPEDRAVQENLARALELQGPTRPR